jgi:hypothetical protein
MNVADRSMLLGIARIFWAFDVRHKIGEDGKKIMPQQDEFHEGFVAIPKRFEVDIKPRSGAKREIVEREWERAKKSLDAEGQFL